MIFRDPPSSWQDLESKVCQIFIESGYVAFKNKTVRTVRGRVAVDVVARDKTQRPHLLILCECKYWSRKIPKSAVHSFSPDARDRGNDVLAEGKLDRRTVADSEPDRNLKSIHVAVSPPDRCDERFDEP